MFYFANNNVIDQRTVPPKAVHNKLIDILKGKGVEQSTDFRKA